MAASIEVISGIGPAMADMLRSNGFTSVEDLANSSVEALVDLPGFGPARARQIIRQANAHLASMDAEQADEDTVANPQDETLEDQALEATVAEVLAEAASEQDSADEETALEATEATLQSDLDESIDLDDGHTGGRGSGRCVDPDRGAL